MPRTVEEVLKECMAAQAELLARSTKLVQLKEQLARIRSQTLFPTMVPFGPVAYFSGHYWNTSKVMVSLGQDYFVECSVDHALQILSRRHADVLQQLDALTSRAEKLKRKVWGQSTAAASGPPPDTPQAGASADGARAAQPDSDRAAAAAASEAEVTDTEIMERVLEEQESQWDEAEREPVAASEVEVSDAEIMERLRRLEEQEMQWEQAMAMRERAAASEAQVGTAAGQDQPPAVDTPDTSPKKGARVRFAEPESDAGPMADRDRSHQGPERPGPLKPALRAGSTASSADAHSKPAARDRPRSVEKQKDSAPRVRVAPAVARIGEVVARDPLQPAAAAHSAAAAGQAAGQQLSAPAPAPAPAPPARVSRFKAERMQQKQQQQQW